MSIWQSNIFNERTMILFSGTERCQCHHVNGAAITTYKFLCPIEENPKCHQYSERIKEFKRPLNYTNCTCTQRRNVFQV